MSVATLMDDVMSGGQFLPEAGLPLTTAELSEAEREEVLAFLSERPVHTVCMAGLVRDNGLASPHNRGTFYGCRNSEGRLEGVALVGHHTLCEARTRRARRELALAAQVSTRTHLIMGAAEEVEEFWSTYADEGQQMRRACRELLFELTRAVDCGAEVGGLRLAAAEDLDAVAPVQAGLCEAESGVNPLEVDPEGFRARCLRRVEQGRTYVLMSEDGRLLFKAEIQSHTPEVVYLEGVYVHPSARGTGLGRRCLTQLTRGLLLKSTRKICLLADEENPAAHAFYRMCGFRRRGVYDTIFLSID
ncbi:MAG TPA: GNAT family N-acetyltransferase [Pyrinomonadaceae bacterium]|nr:GNAT family N-acetyltransferase [Pyrinomonadaceae bacterium]